MSDVVAVALITGGVAVLASFLTFIGERWRAGTDLKRLRERLNVEERRVRADSVRELRGEAVTLLRTWLRRHISLSIDLDFLRLYPDQENLAALIKERIGLMFGPAEEVSLAAILSRFSSAGILEAVYEIEQERNAIRNAFGPLQALAERAPLTQEQLQELKELWEPVHQRSRDLDRKIADLNRQLELYVIGEDL